ncbi:MAG TPA: uL15 family ribosomal protein [Candidatus Methanomethylicus sp.]|nr:uL15 family ribosomal protein [Candidatus Methanomethylicus sp.]
MVVRKDRKVRRQRGSRLYGWGQVGQHRKSGMRGGYGAAGFHKHKWSYAVKYDLDHYGKDGFVRPAAVTNEINAINVGAIASIVHGKVLSQDEKGRAVLDMSSMGIDKLLGGGKIDFPIVIKVTGTTELAKKKVADAGGEVQVAE